MYAGYAGYADNARSVSSEYDKGEPSVTNRPKPVAPAAGQESVWTYPRPSPGFEPIAGAIAVMAALVDRCTVNGEQVVPQPGGFYSGWITSWIVGPFKGIQGSNNW